MKVPLLVIGGGLSGIAAAIRTSRFLPDVLLIEQHSRLGGLNSYFYRNGTLFETGLHAITNFAPAADKHAPLNRLLRQLKLKREALSFCEQLESEIVFANLASLRFSNNRQLLIDSVHSVFPKSSPHFEKLLRIVVDFDPFRPSPFRSARAVVTDVLQDNLLTEMLFCPLMFYGSSRENDMDLGQFVIMFRSIFLEGFFRPSGTIKDLLDLLQRHLVELGGKIRTNCGAKKILTRGGEVIGVQLNSGEVIECDNVLSTIGHHETLRLVDNHGALGKEATARLSFVETIFQLPQPLQIDDGPKTIVFYNHGNKFSYRCPDELVDFQSGVVCFPNNFKDLQKPALHEVRTTHLANYSQWKHLAHNPDRYSQEKVRAARCSSQALANLFGSFSTNIVYENTFTPVTIERYTAKHHGAVYGSPDKVPDGRIGYENLFLAGTDQGFLGIIGSMLSGVTIVNQHILPKI